MNKTFVEKILYFKSYFNEKGFPIIATIWVSTFVSFCEDFGEMNELHLENSVFDEVMQLTIGSCKIDGIALCAFLPVVSVNYKTNQIIFSGKITSLSIDCVEIDS